MATKDWIKIDTGDEIYFRSRKGYRRIRIFQNIFYKWAVKDDKYHRPLKIYSSKSQALKFAKSYMEKH